MQNSLVRDSHTWGFENPKYSSIKLDEEVHDNKLHFKQLKNEFRRAGTTKKILKTYAQWPDVIMRLWACSYQDVILHSQGTYMLSRENESDLAQYNEVLKDGIRGW